MIVVAALLMGMAIGGAIAQRRRIRADQERFAVVLEQANKDLAEAHAADRGWEYGRLEAAARRAFTDRHPAVEIERILLTQVDDRPGIEHDAAVFAVETGGTRHEVRVVRRGDEWEPA